MMVWLVDMKIMRRSDYLHNTIRHFTNFGPPIFNEMIKNHLNLSPFRANEAGDAVVDGLVERILIPGICFFTQRGEYTGESVWEWENGGAGERGRNMSKV